MKTMAKQIVMLITCQAFKTAGRSKDEAYKRCIQYAVERDISLTIGQLDEIFDVVYTKNQ